MNMLMKGGVSREKYCRAIEAIRQNYMGTRVTARACAAPVSPLVPRCLTTHSPLRGGS